LTDQVSIKHIINAVFWLVIFSLLHVL
jgi:hypothetical protein